MPSAQWMAARAASFALYYSGGLWLYEAWHRRFEPAPRCMVINYHRVVSEPLGYHDIAVAPETFRSHVSYMVGRGLHFLSLARYHAYLSGEFELEGDSILLTLDDGYRDNYSAAFPILREFDIPATVFLCTGPLQSGTPLWWDRAVLAVRAVRAGRLGPIDAQAGIPHEVQTLLRTSATGNDRHASRVMGELIDWLKNRPVAERTRILAALEAAAPASAGQDLMLTWDMIREMRAGGIDFGAHSLTHPVFSEISPSDARAEILESKREIEEHLGEEVTAFAYPYGKAGYFDASTIEALQATGIRWAYTTENGVNSPGSDAYKLRRNGIRDIPLYFLAVRLAGVFESAAFSALRSRLKSSRETQKP